MFAEEKPRDRLTGDPVLPLGQGGREHGCAGPAEGREKPQRRPGRRRKEMGGRRFQKASLGVVLHDLMKATTKHARNTISHVRCCNNGRAMLRGYPW